MTALFAITDIPNSTIVRFPLAEEIRNEVMNYFRDQEAAFRVDAANQIQFDGKYKPDEGECLVIDGFIPTHDFAACIDNAEGVAAIPSASEAFSKIKAIFVGYRDPEDRTITILLQHFDKKKILSTRGFSLFHSGNVYKKVDGIGLSIDPRLSAVLKGRSLNFFSFHVARQIFDLSAHYKAATEGDIRDFAASPFLQVDNVEGVIAVSDTIVRRKITLVHQSRILENVPIEILKAAALDLDVELITTLSEGVEVIKLPDDKAGLKDILSFLSEDYYLSPFSRVPHVTNSRRVKPRRG
ncbi:DUF4868 domain-containing protein (plasmid) [Azospirillum sp. 412522]|nr:hypothetical protein [Azospirillum sp. 412522]MBY6266597.1 DUF4868 domain-containing protein [Azospirillum sp. 412522]